MPDSVVLTPTGSGQAGVTNGSDIVSQVARIAGGEGEMLLRQQALDCINRVRIELNQHELTFTKTTDATITLVIGQATYALSTQFNKPSYCITIDATGDRHQVLDFYDDQYFSHLTPSRSSQSGEPRIYALRNSFGDGFITVYPTPDSGTASTYRLVVEYFARIGAISDSPDPINLPEECTNVLVVGGQSYMLRERDKSSPVTVQAFADYQRTKNLLITWNRRYSEENMRMKIRPYRPLFDPTIYIKVK